MPGNFESRCEDLVLLVGSNPLPNFLSTIVLNPGRVHLIYTDQTERIMDQLSSALEKRLTHLEIFPVPIAGDGTDAREVQKAVKGLPDSAHLNYTGGTKIMAAHARKAFKGPDRHASYLDERHDQLRLDDGDAIPLSTQRFDLSVHDILALHGISHVQEPERPTTDQAEKIAGEVFKDPKAKPSKGYWLEVWTANKVHEMLGQMNNPPQIGLKCIRDNGRDFEIDVAFINKHRLYAISCTASIMKKPKDTLVNCKRKLFEIAIRAQQLGGALARSALVCLMDGGNEKSSYVEQLRNDIADIWDATHTPEVFGLSDLKEWAGVHGGPDVGSLKKWLES